MTKTPIYLHYLYKAEIVEYDVTASQKQLVEGLVFLLWKMAPSSAVNAVIAQFVNQALKDNGVEKEYGENTIDRLVMLTLARMANDE